MKNFKNCWFFLGLMMTMLCFTACSDDDEEVIPSFPTNSESISVSAGETKSLAFTANMAWNLSSNKTWCLLGSEQKQNISGDAGEQSVTVTINDEGLTFSEDKAEITLSMGTESKVIASITRGAKAYEFTIKDEQDNVVTTLEIGSTGDATFYAEANFEFAATYNEEELIVTMSEAAAGTFNYEFNIEVLQIKNAGEYQVTFQNEDGSQTFPYKVKYAGMDPMKISFNPGSAWGVNVAADGQTYYRNINVDNVYDAPYNVTVSALNDEYTLTYYHYDNNWGMTQYQLAYETPWFSVEDDAQGNLSVSFAENTGKERKGYLFAFPNAYYETIQDDLDGFIIEDMNANVWEMSVAAEKYLIAEFVQEAGQATTTSGFTVKLWGYQDVEVTKIEDQDVLDYAMGNLMCYTGEVYGITVDKGSWLQIFPNLPEETWTCDIYPIFNGVTEEQVEAMGYEPSIADEGHNFGILVPEDVTDPIYIGIRDNMWTVHKVLVIYTY